MALLFKLPMELLEQVVDLLNCKSIAHLRLVSKKAHHIATSTFGRKHLHTLRPILTLDCLEALIELSANGMLRRYVKGNLFASYALIPCVQIAEVALSRWKPGSARRLLWRHNYCSRKQEELVESGRHVQLIAQALANFREDGLPLTLGTFDLEPGKRKPCYKGWGADEFYGDLFRVDIWLANGGEALDAVVKAAKLCNNPLEAIKIDACACMMVPMDISESLRSDDTQLERLLANTLLDADHGTPDPSIDIEPTPSNDNPHVDQILTRLLINASRGCSNLSLHVKTTPVNDEHMTSDLYINWQTRRLSFQSQQCYQETTFARFRGMADMGNLAVILGTNKFREVDLSHCRVEAQILARFLRAHAGTLRRLKHSRLVFCGANLRRMIHRSVSATNFLVMLRDDFKNLDYLELEDLRGSDAGWPILPLFPADLRLGGRQDIESELGL